jgi:hypothetical protein
VADDSLDVDGFEDVLQALQPLLEPLELPSLDLLLERSVT